MRGGGERAGRPQDIGDERQSVVSANVQGIEVSGKAKMVTMCFREVGARKNNISGEEVGRVEQARP